VETGCELRMLKGHSEGVLSVALGADGRQAISASHDKTLKVWNVMTGRGLCTLKGHSDWVRKVALSADGRLAVSISLDEPPKVWDVVKGRELRTLVGHSDFVNGVALSADGHLAITTSDDRVLRVWDVPAGQIILTLATSKPLGCCAITPNGKTIVAGDNAGEVHFLEWVGGSKVRARSGWRPRWLKELLGRRER
jgi:WD40 repeat protein